MRTAEGAARETVRVTGAPRGHCLGPADPAGDLSLGSARCHGAGGDVGKGHVASIIPDCM